MKEMIKHMLSKLLKAGSLILLSLVVLGCNATIECKEGIVPLKDYTGEINSDYGVQKAIIRLPKGFKLSEVVDAGDPNNMVGYRIEPMDSGYIPKTSYYIDDLSPSTNVRAYVYTFIESW